MVWAKAARGIWALNHVFYGKLYFTTDIVKLDNNDRQPTLIPKPAAVSCASTVSSHGIPVLPLFFGTLAMLVQKGGVGMLWLCECPPQGTRLPASMEMC